MTSSIETRAHLKTTSAYDRYFDDHRAFQNAWPNGPAWLSQIRERGLASFDALRFPTAARGNEAWKYTNVSPIANSAFEYVFPAEGDGVSPSRVRRLAPWDDDWATMVFVDGSLSESLSNVPEQGDELRLSNLAGTVSRDGDVFEAHLGRYADADGDGFTAVNTAFLRDGAFAHLPDSSSEEATLHLVYVTTEHDRQIVTHPRTLVVTGRHTKLNVVESYVSECPGSYFTNAVTELVVGEGAEIEHYRYMMEGPRAFHIGNTQVHLDRDSTFSSVSFSRGSRIARNGLSVLMDGPGSSCNLYGLYRTSGRQHIDNHIDVDHAKPHASSDQLFKGILAGRSRAVFSGRVLVRENAQKTFARQSDKNLLLSEGARINTKPSLEIYADDVQCFHGATAGAVADEALFYMRSRGLDEETAKALLVRGFASEIIEKVKPDALREHMEGEMSQ
jgi:Fe-S cluster assembly protein SufD